MTVAELYKQTKDELCSAGVPEAEENARLLLEEYYCLKRIDLLADPDKEFGTKPTEEMLREACAYAQKAVEEGEKKAEFILGYYCTLPFDGGPDLNKAAGHFSKAANHGEERAKKWLARLVKGDSGLYSMR